MGFSSMYKRITKLHDLFDSYGGMHEDYSYTLWLDMLQHQCASSEIQKDMEQLGFIFD